MTFSIDTNGIVQVSARDLGTGRSQEITITGSGNMSREEIDRAMRDAENYAEQDRRNREEAERRERRRAESEKRPGDGNDDGAMDA